MEKQLTRRLFALFLAVGLCCPQSVDADYAVPEIAEKLVVLVPSSDLKIRVSPENPTVIFKTIRRTFRVDLFWLQDSTYSDGLCTGINPANSNDPQSAASYLIQLEKEATRHPNRRLLVTVIREKRFLSGFCISDIRFFDADKFYDRLISEAKHRLPEMLNSPIEFRGLSLHPAKLPKTPQEMERDFVVRSEKDFARLEKL